MKSKVIKKYVVSIVWLKNKPNSVMSIVNTVSVGIVANSDAEAFGLSYQSNISDKSIYDLNDYSIHTKTVVLL